LGELIDGLLKAPALSVALALAVVLALLVYKLVSVKQKPPEKVDSNPIMNNAWFARAEKHFRQGHDHANLLATLRLEVDRVKRDIEKLQEDLLEHKADATQRNERILRVELQMETVREGVADLERSAKEHFSHDGGSREKMLEAVRVLNSAVAEGNRMIAEMRNGQ
jgi:chromosome segregation ATPase